LEKFDWCLFLGMAQETGRLGEDKTCRVVWLQRTEEAGLDLAVAINGVGVGVGVGFLLADGRTPRVGEQQQLLKTDRRARGIASSHEHDIEVCRDVGLMSWR
jgi:hypothetical protein